MRRLRWCSSWRISAADTKLNTKKKAWYQLKDPVSGILLVLLSKDKQKELKGKGKGKKRKNDDE